MHPMNTDRARTDDLFDLARVLMLLQGAILIATALESVVWAIALPGADGLALLLTGASAVAILAPRAPVPAVRGRLARVVYVAARLLGPALALGALLSLLAAPAA